MFGYVFANVREQKYICICSRFIVYALCLFFVFILFFQKQVKNVLKTFYQFKKELNMPIYEVDLGVG